jgi:hypothetical protein
MPGSPGRSQVRAGAHTLAALVSIRNASPDGRKICIILDYLSANKTPAIHERVAAHRIELCFTPTDASWADPIDECHFGSLRAFVIGNSDYPNHLTQARQLQAYDAGAAPTPAIPTSWPPNVANLRASAANVTDDGADQNHRPPEQPGNHQPEH